jgi:mannose-6-phosphate isomerase-like protein (cupin superfamily)
MADRGGGYLLRAGAGVGGDSGLKASAASSGGSLTVIDSDTDGGAPPHTHTREDEAMYVLAGSIIAHVGDEEFHAGEGDFVFMPRGVQHDWDVEGGSARVLIIAAPGGLDRFLEEFHAAGDWAARDEVAGRFGLTFPR